MDLYHLGRVLTALVDLHAAGEIDLEFVSRTGDSSKSELSVVLHVTNSETRESRGVVIEVADRADRFDERALAGCDVYYKRSFHRPGQEALAPPLRAKLRPFGLNYSARGAGAARIGTKVLLRRLVKLLAHPVRALRVLREDFEKVSNFVDTPMVADMEYRPEQTPERTVIYQTRIWTQSDLGSDSPDEVNAPRIKLVRLLKEGLGPAFRGGLVPTEMSLREYPELVTREAAGRRSYLAFSRPALVGINTRGIHHSMGFKIGEYLAASKCMVTEPLRNELPVPLEPERHFLRFDSPEECVAACQRLLRDAEFAEAMRRANWDYYCREVRPTAQLMKCLAGAFEPAALV